MKRLLCLLGLHRWRLVRLTWLMGDKIERCRRCGAGREIGLSGTHHWRPEMMERAFGPLKKPNERGGGLAAKHEVDR